MRCLNVLAIFGVAQVGSSVKLDLSVPADPDEDVERVVNGVKQFYMPGYKVHFHRGTMPRIGMGTCCRKSSKGQAMVDSLKTFFSLGGRLVDTSERYGNLREIGQAINESNISREELWIVGKLQNCVELKCGEPRTPEQLTASAHKQLEELGVGYFDTLLLESYYPDDNIVAEQWKTMSKLRIAKLTKTIGIANVGQIKMEQLMENTHIRAQVTEMKFNPSTHWAFRAQMDWWKKQEIIVIVYNSLRYHVRNTAIAQSENAVRYYEKIAEKHNVTPAVVLLKWALDQHVMVIPGMTSREHMEENLFGQMKAQSWKLEEFANDDEYVYAQNETRKKDKDAAMVAAITY